MRLMTVLRSSGQCTPLCPRGGRTEPAAEAGPWQFCTVGSHSPGRDLQPPAAWGHVGTLWFICFSDVFFENYTRTYRFLLSYCLDPVAIRF